MGLAETVNHALFKARLVEQLIHDPGPWFVELFGQKFQAEVEVKEDMVVVHSIIPLVGVEVEPGNVNLYCKDRLASSRWVDPSGYVIPDFVRLAWGFGLGVQVTQ